MLVAQLCLSLRDPMVCSPPGSSVHGVLQVRILQWVAMPTPGDLPNLGILNPGLPHCRQILDHLSYQSDFLSIGQEIKKLIRATGHTIFSIQIILLPSQMLGGNP